MEVRVLPLRTREDAERDEVVATLDDASLIFFSGGNPWRLAEAVRDTPFWHRLTERLEDGLAYAGCSAGVACLTERTFDSDAQDMEQMYKPGIGQFRGLLFGPHWDIVDDWIPGATAAIAGSIGPGETLIGIDEHTAIVGDGTTWRVEGVAGVHVLRDGAWTDHAAGSTFDLAIV
jgi:cyanophycinase